MSRWTQPELDHLRELIAAGHTSAQVADLIGRCQESILRAAATHGLGPWKHIAALPTRPDRDAFAKRMTELTPEQMASAYRVTRKTVYKWARQFGLAWPESKRAWHSRRLTHAKPIQQTAGEAYQRDMSEAGQAADFMRRDRPVFRCDVNGNQNQGGKYWMCGIVWMTNDELIIRARSKGFRPVRFAA